MDPTVSEAKYGKAMYVRLTPQQAEKVRRMRLGSGRGSDQNVISFLIDKEPLDSPHWNQLPQEEPEAQGEPAGAP